MLNKLNSKSQACPDFSRWTKTPQRNTANGHLLNLLISILVEKAHLQSCSICGLCQMYNSNAGKSLNDDSLNWFQHYISLKAHTRHTSVVTMPHWLVTNHVISQTRFQENNKYGWNVAWRFTAQSGLIWSNEILLTMNTTRQVIEWSAPRAPQHSTK